DVSVFCVAARSPIKPTIVGPPFATTGGEKLWAVLGTNFAPWPQNGPRGSPLTAEVDAVGGLIPTFFTDHPHPVQ
ncbi:MAG TPA: hypothetical protein QF564_09255, partial [Pirellulaceae bacterium]|nr:hypothetical protein [Pirellulaceae bacterium]